MLDKKMKIVKEVDKILNKLYEIEDFTNYSYKPVSQAINSLQKVNHDSLLKAWEKNNTQK